MNITAEAYLVLLLLVPGFVASRVLGMVAVRRGSTTRSEIAEALIFSVVIYAALYAAGSESAFVQDPQKGVLPLPGLAPVPYALAAAVALGLACGFSINRDYHMRLLRFCRVTVATARVNTWVDVFTDHDPERDVLITYKDGRRLHGWIGYFSDDVEEGLLYLWEPAWVADDGTLTGVGARGVLLVDRDGIESVMFLKGGNDDVEKTIRDGR